MCASSRGVPIGMYDRFDTLCDSLERASFFDRALYGDDLSAVRDGSISALKTTKAKALRLGDDYSMSFKLFYLTCSVCVYFYVHHVLAKSFLYDRLHVCTHFTPIQTIR